MFAGETSIGYLAKLQPALSIEAKRNLLLSAFLLMQLRHLNAA